MPASITSAQVPPPLDPFIVPSKSGIHRQTLILLHGRGSNGPDFACDLLQTHIPGFGCGATLPSIFPHATFVFPTAAKRRAQAFNRSLVNQWFDLWDVKNQREKEDLQFQGLEESAQSVHRLLESAIRDVGSANVVLWGLSQGCATALISLLLWNGEHPAALVGMCGWLPLRERTKAACETETDAEDDLFEAEAGCKALDKAGDAVSCLRELLGDSDQSGEAAILRTPIILCHGTLDEKVDVCLGRQASSFLEELDCATQWQEYQGLGHWHSGEMLQDIVAFIAKRTIIPLSPRLSSSDKSVSH